MPVLFTTPIAHDPLGNYAPFNNAYTPGRSFQQPLDSAPTAQFSPGLEIFCSSAGTAADLFAFLNGSLRWQAATAAAPGDRLILDTDVEVMVGSEENGGNFGGLNILAAPVARTIYENVDTTEVEAALVALLTAAFNAAPVGVASDRWHPSMRMTIKVNGTWYRLRTYLRQNLPVAGTIAALVGDFVTGAAGALIDRIPVLVGDRIGRAAPYLAADPLPAAPRFVLGLPNDPNRARRLTFQTIDRGGQHINPLYYFHVMMNRLLLAPQPPPVVLSYTEILQNGVLGHPLIDVYPLLIAAAPPRVRERINNYSAFRLGPLGDFHGFGTARLQWRYTDATIFEVQDAPTAPVIPANQLPRMQPDAQERARVQTIWNSYGAEIVTISEALQVPCEVIVGLICIESLPTLPERVVRLEPLRSEDRRRLAMSPAASAFETEYDRATGYRGAVGNVVAIDAQNIRFDIALVEPTRWAANALSSTFRRVLWGTQRLRIRGNTGANVNAQGRAVPTANFTITIERPANLAQAEAWIMDGYAPPDPGVPGPPWPAALAVHPASNSTLTWDELLPIVRATLGWRVSPGLLQTLVKRAAEEIALVNDVAPSLYNDLGIPAPPLVAGSPDEGGLLNDWLLHGLHSIVAGAAHIRRCYNRAPTAFDLPLVGSLYNAGHQGGWPIAVADTKWGLHYHGTYVERAGPHYNAAVDLLNATPGAVPRVRFQR